ncbi:Antimicrobial peptide system, SdpB family protein [Tenacibaculum litopenaei]|uniref:sporulation-delaying protein SdpB family protein n=1 Tax=Tenacibaculum litopenaei TaxID=396016 RepID=UPI003895018D
MFYLKKIINILNERTNKWIENFRWSNTYGVGRSFIAMSLFLTLISSDIFRLIKPLGSLNEVHNLSYISRISIFYLLRDHIILAKIICLIILGLVISGWRPRFTGFFHWWVAFSFSTSSLILEGGDQIAEILTLLLIPVTLADHRRFHWQNNIKCYLSRSLVADTIVLFIISINFIISLQVAFIYFHASVGKYSSEEWANGTAIYYWFDNSIFGLSNFWRKIMFPLLKNPYLVTGMTWGTLLLEILLFMGIAISKSEPKRKNLLCLGIGFHFLIGLFFGLWTFFITMTGALILYLGPRDGFTKKYFKW